MGRLSDARWRAEGGPVEGGLGWTVVGRTQMSRSLAVPIATRRACPARWCSRGRRGYRSEAPPRALAAPARLTRPGGRRRSPGGARRVGRGGPNGSASTYRNWGAAASRVIKQYWPAQHWREPHVHTQGAGQMRRVHRGEPGPGGSGARSRRPAGGRDTSRQTGGGRASCQASAADMARRSTTASYDLGQRPGVVQVPFAGLPPTPPGLVWCAAHEDEGIRSPAHQMNEGLLSLQLCGLRAERMPPQGAIARLKGDHQRG